MRCIKQGLTLCCLAAVAFVAAAPANDKPSSGKDLYKANCRVCHAPGSPNGEFSPMSLIQDQWKKFFTTKFEPTHKEIVVPGQNKKLFEVLTPDQLKTIQKFCVDHAADSEQPQTCS